MLMTAFSAFFYYPVFRETLNIAAFKHLDQNLHLFRTGLCVTIAMLVALAGACKRSEQSRNESTRAFRDEPAKRQFVTIGTAPPGGAFFMVGNAIANVVGSKLQGQNLVVSAESTRGTQENIRRLAAGEIDFGMANAAISYFAARGEGTWKHPHDIRAVATMAPNVGVFIAPRRAGIRTVSELAGKRVVLGPAGAGFHWFLRPLLQANGVSYETLTELNNTYTGTVDMLADGKADAAFMGGAVPIPAVTQACASQDIVFLTFGADIAARLQEYPFYYPVTVAADVYSDLDRDLTAINVGNMQLVTHAEISEELVHAFTRALYENRDAVAAQHPAGRALAPANITRNTGIPFHPGAIRFYREAGIWPSD